MQKVLCILAYTTKKLSYCGVFFLALLKTAVIEEPIVALFETIGIGNPITAAQNQCFIKALSLPDCENNRFILLLDFFFFFFFGWRVVGVKKKFFDTY